MVKRNLERPVLAMFIRFLPKEWKSWPCMRVEVYGKPASKSTKKSPQSVEFFNSRAILYDWLISSIFNLPQNEVRKTRVKRSNVCRIPMTWVCEYCLQISSTNLPWPLTTYIAAVESTSG